MSAGRSERRPTTDTTALRSVLETLLARLAPMRGGDLMALEDAAQEAEAGLAELDRKEFVDNAYALLCGRCGAESRKVAGPSTQLVAEGWVVDAQAAHRCPSCNTSPVVIPFDDREHDCRCGRSGYRAWDGDDWITGLVVIDDEGQTVDECSSCERELVAVPVAALGVRSDTEGDTT